jgi:hypothetical protein
MMDDSTHNGQIAPTDRTALLQGRESEFKVKSHISVRILIGRYRLFDSDGLGGYASLLLWDWRIQGKEPPAPVACGVLSRP